MRHAKTWLLLLAACGAACRRDMQDQPKYKDLRGSAFFEDGRSARPVVEGTVPRGRPYGDTPFLTGKQNGQPVAQPNWPRQRLQAPYPPVCRRVSR